MPESLPDTDRLCFSGPSPAPIKVGGGMESGTTVPDREYGVIFCTTGKEEQVARELTRRDQRFRAYVARREWYKYFGRQRKKVVQIALPGYVFFTLPAGTTISRFERPDHFLKILRNSENDWRLDGADLSFAKWIVSYDGLLGTSRAYQEGDRIRIISGPMADVEGQIRRIDRRKSSGEVRIRFHDRVVSVWLNFDIMQVLPESAPLSVF